MSDITAASSTPVTDATTPVPYTAFQVQQVLRPTTPPSTTAAIAIATEPNPAFIDTQSNSISVTAASTTATHPPTPLSLAVQLPVDEARADVLRMWADLAALSDLQRGELLNEMATQQPAAVFTAHDQLSQLHSLLLATPAVSHTISLPPPTPYANASTEQSQARRRQQQQQQQQHDDKWKAQPQAGDTPPAQPSSTDSPAPDAAKHAPEQQQPDRNPRKFIQWYISCLFPTLHSNTVNYCRINTPWSIVWRWLHTPIAFSHMSPTSWWNALWTWIGVFVGIGCIAILHQYYTNAKHDWPILFASHGALATIIFTTPQNPVVLPYAMFGGTLVSTFYAVVIQRGMNTDEWLWLAVALSAAASITTMQLLGCSHPPGGALSVLYIAVPTLQVLGYWYIIAAEAGVMIMFLVALIVNNIPKLEGRRYPQSWFS